MSNRNWRSLKWSQFSRSEKFWFIVMCAVLALILLAVGVDGAGVMEVPDWAVLALAAMGFYSAYRTTTDLGMFTEVEDEPDNEDDPESDE